MCGAELRFADIRGSTLDTWWHSWTGVHGSGAGGWDWPAIVGRVPRRAAVLPLAIWYGTDLCGLAVGYLSRCRRSGVRHTVTLTFLERRAEPPPVRLRGLVTLLAIAVAQNYGVARGARRIRLRNPDPNLLWFYRLLGFEIASKAGHPVCCEREIP